MSLHELMGKRIKLEYRGDCAYAYEITSSYDKRIKNTRYAKRYLGTYENGQIVRKKTALPKRSLDYGEIVPFIQIIEALPVRKILDTFLPKNKVETLLTLAINRLVHPVAMNNIQTWYQGTYLTKLYGDLPLASQTLSNFLAQIGDSSLHMDFSGQFIKEYGNGQSLLYDITSLSSTSTLIDLLEFGYNRDNDFLPQMNLSLIANKDLGVPLFYDVYPGSIVDVTTLKNTILKLNAFGLTNPTMILDRGFFSATNIVELLDHPYDFILPATFALKAVKTLVSRESHRIEKPECLQKYNGDPLFVKDVQLDVGDRHVDGFLFYDLGREKDQKTTFYNHLHQVVELLEKRFLRSWEKPGKVFDDISGKFGSYLRWKVHDGRFQITVRAKSVAQRVNRMGFTVILYRGGYYWEDVLGWYRERDMIEKMFRMLKRDLEATPLRVQKTETARGWLFVTFLALILRTRLMNLMTKCGLIGNYSLSSLLLELQKLKMIELADGSSMITERTKKQKDIIKNLELKV